VKLGGELGHKVLDNNIAVFSQPASSAYTQSSVAHLPYSSRCCISKSPARTMSRLTEVIWESVPKTWCVIGYYSGCRTSERMR